MRRTFAFACAAAFAPMAQAQIEETVYVETDLDTDGDGQKDRIYASVSRPAGGTSLPTMYAISPYAMGGNDVPNHGVDFRRLPQDADESGAAGLGSLKERLEAQAAMEQLRNESLERGYASVSAHSIGTGRSTGCPTVGDEAETLGAKAVIDWLNGRARGYDASGREVTASWANGNVGMTGVSYNGTLPNMVATTGVEGLKAIIPVAAISDWYDYYRAGGLVVGPGGYIGEDADVLGKYIVRAGACGAAMTQMGRDQGREHGDFDAFWQARDYVSRADGVRAAVFIMHGQTDWNVKQRHAIRWYEALDGKVPLRMWLHRGAHGSPDRGTTTTQRWAWFDRYVKGERNGVENEPKVEVEDASRTWTAQGAWPSERTTSTRYFLNGAGALSVDAGAPSTARFTDAGKTTRLEALLGDPTRVSASRLAFLSAPLASATLISGTPRVTLNLAVMNRRAANVTVAVFELPRSGSARVITRGWADPQNASDMTRGALLTPGTPVTMTFDLEPKQATLAAGSRLGILVASTDYEYTIRPDAGTQLSVELGSGSFVDLDMAR